MKTFFLNSRHWLALGLIVVLASTAFGQQDQRDELFAEADLALAAAKEARATLLAPRNYGDAMDRYREAEEKLLRGRSIDGIKKDIAAATSGFRKAVEATRLANVTFASAIQARNDAEEASASSYAKKDWLEAEEKFNFAATRLEAGNANQANTAAESAEKLYRSAELTAVKVNYLDETRRLLAQADKNKVERTAPKTLARANSLLAQAEQALEKNRYDTDEPRNLARQAKYEVKHAMYLASVLEPIRKRDVSMEDFALANEKPIKEIASLLDIVAELDQGFEKTTQEITANIDSLQRDAYDLIERRSQIMALEGEIQMLEKRLGTQSQRIAEQEKQNQKFKKIESMFGRDEAQIFRQGQNVLIRPIGLVFASGSSQIESENFNLLRKVQDAIRIFPNSTIVIEGHTDSYGGDEINLTLSQKRAESVRDYLIANMRDLEIADVQATGFGEARPVANNETVEGRAKNRRIDVFIQARN